MKQKFVLLATLFNLFFMSSSFAQEQIGLRMENYAGVGSLSINPTWQTTNPLAWDLNLIEASVFMDNNYAYFENARRRDIINAETIRLFDEEPPFADDDLILNFYNNGRKKYISIFTEVMGPSLSIRINKNHYAGFFLKVRAGISTQRFPDNLDYLEIVDRPRGLVLEVAEAQLAAMSWSEIGINYAHKIETYDGYLSIGGNIKFLQGYEAFYAQNNQLFEGVQQQGDTILIDTPDVGFGFTDSNIDGEDFERSRNGTGFGLDIGVTYIIEGNEDNYKLKLGASILDLGGIQFNQNARNFLIDYDAGQSFVSSDYENQDDIDELIEQASLDIYNDVDALQVGNSFSIGLPTALSLQADYMVMPMFYINALLVQRLSIRKPAVQRGNLLAVAPRFEHRWFAANLPLSVYNYQHVDIGLSLRLAFLTIGSENLGGLFGENNRYTGADFYVGLKVNPFNIGLNWGNGGGRRGGRSKVKCYSF